ncbi:MAG: tetraacyldisaccharide 4'-kinase [Bacteroidetes bacterium]|nr:tetraacyldisaccharide 4'-kinase [Bacteroidota bacterium]
MFSRNLLFDWSILKSASFGKPIISVGNLSVGGSGKTPMVMYLVDYLLSKNKQVAVLSRGYKRKSKGYKLVEMEGHPEEFSDEAMMIQNKFPKCKVAVAENRVDGIQQLMNTFPELDVILLDDAFQHRFVRAKCNILLSDYYKPFWKDFVLPSGYLRESRAACRRADMVVVSKTPANITAESIESCKRVIIVKYNKPLYFTSIEYSSLRSAKGQLLGMDELGDYSILLFTGIGNSNPLTEYIETKAGKVVSLKFPDHHWYSKKDFSKIEMEFNKLAVSRKLILTTEKDFSRIRNSWIENLFIDLPLYFISIQMKFIDRHSESQFKQKIDDYVK